MSTHDLISLLRSFPSLSDKFNISLIIHMDPTFHKSMILYYDYFMTILWFYFFSFLETVLTCAILSSFLNNLLPPEELETYVFSQAFNTNDLGFEELPDELRSLIDETADFIESPNAGEVIKRLVHTGLSVSVSKISKLYPAVVDTPEKIVDVTEGDVAQQQEQATIKLASILANISRQAHSIAAGSPIDPNEYVVEMGNVGELNAFSAVVYSNFDWRVMDKDGKA